MNMNASKHQEIVKDREAWQVVVYRVAKNQTQLLATEQQQQNNYKHTSYFPY